MENGRLSNYFLIFYISGEKPKALTLSLIRFCHTKMSYFLNYYSIVAKISIKLKHNVWNIRIWECNPWQFWKPGLPGLWKQSIPESRDLWDWKIFNTGIPWSLFFNPENFILGNPRNTLLSIPGSRKTKMFTKITIPLWISRKIPKSFITKDIWSLRPWIIIFRLHNIINNDVLSNIVYTLNIIIEYISGKFHIEKWFIIIDSVIHDKKKKKVQHADEIILFLFFFFNIKTTPCFLYTYCQSINFFFCTIFLHELSSL